MPHVVYQTGVLYGNTYYYELRYLRRDAGAWSAAQSVSSLSPVDAGGYASLAIGADNVVHIAYRNYFRSALFGSANYLQIYSIYFSELGAARTSAQSNYVAVSSAPALEMRGMSVATRGGQLVIAYIQDTFDRFYTVRLARLTAWAPMVAALRPDAAHHTATTSFDVSWLDHDPDSAAKIRWYVRDNQWAYTELPGEWSENDNANQATLDVSNLARGDYSLEVRISDADFVGSYWNYAAPTALTIENRVPSVPTLQSPADGATVDVAQPTVQHSAVSDGDSDPVTYVVQFARNADGSDVVVTSAAHGAATWQVSPALTDGTYYWRVRAQDDHGGVSDWSASRRMVVALPVAAPAAPAPAPAPANPDPAPVQQQPADAGNAQAQQPADSGAGNAPAQQPADAGSGSAPSAQQQQPASGGDATVSGASNGADAGASGGGASSAAGGGSAQAAGTGSAATTNSGGSNSSSNSGAAASGAKGGCSLVVE